MKHFFESIHDATSEYVLVGCYETMNDRFMSMRKVEMTSLADQLFLDYKKSMRKDQIASKLEDHFTKDLVRQELSELSDHAFALLKKLVNNSVAALDLFESHCLSYLADAGYVSYIQSYHNYYTDHQTLELVKEVISEEGFEVYRHKKAFLKSTINYFDFMYMEAAEPILLSIMNEREKKNDKMSYEEVRHLVEELDPIMVYNGKGKYISIAGMRSGSRDFLKEILLVKDLTYPDLDFLEDYMNYDLPIHDENFQALIGYLIFEAHEEPLYAYDKARMVFYMSMCDENPQKIIDEVMREISTVHADKIFALVMVCFEYAPHRCLGGATQSSFLEESLEKEGGYRLPKTKEVTKMIESSRAQLEASGLTVIEEEDSYFIQFPAEDRPDLEPTELLN